MTLKKYRKAFYTKEGQGIQLLMDFKILMQFLILIYQQQILIPNAGTDKEDPDALYIIVLSAVVNSHYSEVDEEEERRTSEKRRFSEVRRYKEDEVRRTVDLNVYQKAKIKCSLREIWRNPEKEVPSLKPSYVSLRNEDMKWKRIDLVYCCGGINFVSGGIRNEVLIVQADQVKYKKKSSQIEYYYRMKEMEPFTRGGIGHSEAEYYDFGLLDKHSLTNRTGEVVSITHLNKLEAIKSILNVFNNVARSKRCYILW